MLLKEKIAYIVGFINDVKMIIVYVHEYKDIRHNHHDSVESFYHLMYTTTMYRKTVLILLNQSMIYHAWL